MKETLYIYTRVSTQLQKEEGGSLDEQKKLYTITEFLDARANDSASFDWTPLDNPTVRKWICSSWTKTITYLNRATITATFQEVFEP